MTEYREIPEWPGYIAGDDGSIWTIKQRNRGILPRQLIPTVIDGYHRIQLRTSDSKVKYRYAHQLVLLAFVGPRPTDGHTRHLDGDRGNNNLSNLCYGTAAENVADTKRHGRIKSGVDHHSRQKTHCPNNHEYSEENTGYNGKGERFCKICRREQGRISDRKRRPPGSRRVA